MPTVTRPETSPRLEANVNLYEPGPSSTSAMGVVMPKYFPVLESFALASEQLDFVGVLARLLRLLLLALGRRRAVVLMLMQEPGDLSSQLRRR